MNPIRRIADFFRRRPGMIGTPPPSGLCGTIRRRTPRISPSGMPSLCVVPVGRLEPLPLDPFIRLAEQFLPPSPAIFGELVIDLGVAIRARHRLHDPGGGQLAERLPRAVGDLHPEAIDPEPEHGDGRFG